MTIESPTYITKPVTLPEELWSWLESQARQQARPDDARAVCSGLVGVALIAMSRRGLRETFDEAQRA